MAELTAEQLAAVEARGKVIVSASAGSGKTFVMIEKLTRAVENGADLDDVLAVTFTKKAAAQMKEKLRSSLIKKLEKTEGAAKLRLKAQISKISSADISTIHSFCARLLRTHFYALGIDGGFDIMAEDDASAKELALRAADELFEKLYESDDGDFLYLLKRFKKKRSDAAFKNLLRESYAKARNVAHYKAMLKNTEKLYTDEGFDGVCKELNKFLAEKYAAVAEAVEAFEKDFPETANGAVYRKIFGEMKEAAALSARGGAFAPPVPFTVTAKPKDDENDRASGELFKKFKASVSRKYSAVREGIADFDTERALFMESGAVATAFSKLLLLYDEEYSRLKRDENKLDYNDLEHMTLELLENEEVKKEIDSRYKYVFVDEYQDVNPVQEEIISAFGGEVFLVGDVKQAIYGFRGSKSLFFAEKYNKFAGGGGTALRLSGNFRSCGRVLDFVNKLFSDAMNERVCGFDYAKNSRMRAEGAYPSDSGHAAISVFGTDEKLEEELGIYSVKDDSRKPTGTREGAAVLSIVERELRSKRYDIEKGEFTDIQPGDICILTRKNTGGSAEGIVRALRGAGYSVSGARDGNICNLPEVKQMLDILSLIDNSEQDIPLVTALLSPLGGFTEDEVAAVRIALKSEGRISFRECFGLFLADGRGVLRQKAEEFRAKLDRLRRLSQILNAGELIDLILKESGLEAVYSSGGGEKLKNILKLAAEGPLLTLSAFLEKIKSGGYFVSAPTSAPSDSIKIMTMHAAKGLEFPVVIVADICRTFKGMDYSELPFDDKYGFAPKYYDTEKMLVRPTLLRRLVKLRSDREELKNELNLFYVACTRAMCDLYVMAAEKNDGTYTDRTAAKCYAETFDMSKFETETAELAESGSEDGEEAAVLSSADAALCAAVGERFMRPYAHAESVELPVKSSASAILKSLREEEPYYVEHELFADEASRETGAERGTAYHRFLELCDFSKNSPSEAAAQLENFVDSGAMTEEQGKLLEAEKLSRILRMKVFSDMDGAEIYREREFLCRLKARDILPTDADDYVLVQGAIDLMVIKEGKVRIIDYKYSKKGDDELKESYFRQLALYKRATSVILGVSEEDISTTIVNICLCREISL